MTQRRAYVRWLPWVCLVLSLCGIARTEGVFVVLRTSCWLLAESAVALLIAAALALVAMLLAKPQLVAYINQVTSRGLELAAALPMVLACGVAVKVASLPVPMAVACVIGVFGGLHCVRAVVLVGSVEASEARAASDAERPHAQASRRAVLSDAISPVLSTLIEQVVGLEAAVAWLELFSGDWSGGWGERLGQAARKNDLFVMLLWTATTVCLSVTLKSKALRPPATPVLASTDILET